MKVPMMLLLGICCSMFHTKSFNLFKELSRFNTKNKDQIIRIFDNVYPVEDGVFYRSQQLNENDFEKYIKMFGIKTVVNLRGDDDQEWWNKEQKIIAQNGAIFFSLTMSAVYLTTKENLIKLLTIYQEAQRPIMVHCIGGADRTGEASALWVLDQQKKIKAKHAINYQ